MSVDRSMFLAFDEPKREEQGPCLYLYRYEDDAYSDPADYTLWAFAVRRFTPRGCWIAIASYPKEKLRWVPLARHPGAYYAFVSESQALFSYMRRKEWHVLKLEHKLNQTKDRLQLAKEHDRLGAKPVFDPPWASEPTLVQETPVFSTLSRKDEA